MKMGRRDLRMTVPIDTDSSMSTSSCATYCPTHFRETTTVDSTKAEQRLTIYMYPEAYRLIDLLPQHIKKDTKFTLVVSSRCSPPTPSQPPYLMVEKLTSKDHAMHLLAPCSEFIRHGRRKGGFATVARYVGRFRQCLPAETITQPRQSMNSRDHS